MQGFVTLSSMFVGNVVVGIVTTVNGHVSGAILPVVGATVTGCAISRMLMAPETPREDDKIN